jgi:hypothetical protein
MTTAVMTKRSVPLGLATLTLIIGCMLLLMPANAHNPIAVKSDGTPIKWGSFPIGYTVDGGGPANALGPLTKAEADALTSSAFGRWEAVTSSTASATQAGSGLGPDGDISTVAEYNDIVSVSNCVALNPIIYDTDGSIIDGLMGVGMKNSILGFAGPCAITDPGGVIVGGRAVMNGFLIPNNSTLNLSRARGTFVHELGHLLGLGHSQLNLNCLTSIPCPAEDILGVPTMFPLALPYTEAPNVDLGETLALDDASAISALYPAGSFATSFGTISGSVRFSDNVNGAQGINVIARRVGDPRTTAVSNVSGMFARVDHGNPALDILPSSFGSADETKRGEFTIPGLPSGAYTLEIESIRSTFTEGSSVGPHSGAGGRNENFPIPSPAIAECLSTPENNIDGAAACTNLSVSAGQTNGNNTILLNETFASMDAFDTIGRNESIATASPLGSGTFSASLSATSPDEDFYLLTVTAGTPVTIETKSRRLTPGRFLDSVIDLMNASGVRPSTCRIGDTGGAFNQPCVNDDFTPSGGSLTFDSKLVFSPTASGTIFLRVTDSYGDARPDFLYELTLTGVVLPDVTLVPNSTNFGNVQAGTTQTAAAITLTNNTSSPLTIDSISLTGTHLADFSRTTTCPLSPATLGAGANCTITPSMSPPAGSTGARSASIVVTHGATGSPQSIPLSGTAVDFAFSFNGTQPGPVTAGGTFNFNFDFDASGGGSASATTFACSGLPEKSSCSFTPASLPAGSTDTTVALAISTTANSIFAAGSVPAIFQGNIPLGIFLASGLAAMIFALGLARLANGRRSAPPRFANAGRLCAAVLFLAAGGYLAGCSGGDDNGNQVILGTPPGSYNVTVTATSGSVQRSTNVSLVVQ